jgi:hypothetical protein
MRADPCAGGSECADSCNEADDNCHDVVGTPCTDDSNVCTNDICDGTGSCDHPDNSAPCDDGLYCTGADTCSAGSCSLHAGDPCPGPDGDADCIESCDEGADSCSAMDLDGSACDDGIFCNAEDICFGGSCAFHAGDPCPGPDGDGDCSEMCDETADSCTAADPNGSACDDGDVCYTADACFTGSCSAGPPLDCDDGDECTAESCDAITGCTHEWICQVPVPSSSPAGRVLASLLLIAAGVLLLTQRRPPAEA